jgi:hypothetical protein
MLKGAPLPARAGGDAHAGVRARLSARGLRARPAPPRRPARPGGASPSARPPPSALSPQPSPAPRRWPPRPPLDLAAALAIGQGAVLSRAAVGAQDLYLMEEGDATAGAPAGMGGDPSVLETHSDDHPSGKHHRMRAAASCFSFDAPAKVRRALPCPLSLPPPLPLPCLAFAIDSSSEAQLVRLPGLTFPTARAQHNRAMSTIHHGNVPGFYMHLQRGMVRPPTPPSTVRRAAPLRIGLLHTVPSRHPLRGSPSTPPRHGARRPVALTPAHSQPPRTGCSRGWKRGSRCGGTTGPSRPPTPSPPSSTTTRPGAAAPMPRPHARGLAWPAPRSKRFREISLRKQGPNLAKEC